MKPDSIYVEINLNLINMPLGKRKATMSYAARAKRARMNFKTTRGLRTLLSRGLPFRFRQNNLPMGMQLITRKVNNLYKMIESKHMTWRTSSGVFLPHNRTTILQAQGGGPLNPFRSANSTDEPMGVGGARIGDEVRVKGLLIRGMVENSANRPKVYYRIMLVKMAKGDTLDDSTFFQGNSTNRMLDQLNTERYTIIAQKIFNAQPSNVAHTSYNEAGEPQGTGGGGQATRLFKLWIPGSKFGPDGRVQYENNAQTQVKFFDYRIVMMTYDWRVSPTITATNIGQLNECYTKLYFKDA